MDVIPMVSSLLLLLRKCRMLQPVLIGGQVMEGAVRLSWLFYTEDFTVVLISQLLNERRWCVICIYSK